MGRAAQRQCRRFLDSQCRVVIAFGAVWESVRIDAGVVRLLHSIEYSLDSSLGVRIRLGVHFGIATKTTCDAARRV